MAGALRIPAVWRLIANEDRPAAPNDNGRTNGSPIRGRSTIEAVQSAHFLLLSGAEMRDPIVVDGPFIMNERSQIKAAAERFRAGHMGRLEPLPENEGAAA